MYVEVSGTDAPRIETIFVHICVSTKDIAVVKVKNIRRNQPAATPHTIVPISKVKNVVDIRIMLQPIINRNRIIRMLVFRPYLLMRNDTIAGLNNNEK